MLEVKNIVEDVIMDVIRDLDEVKQGEIKQSQIIEIASYVLNRTHPMYITSNRGFTNMISRYKNDPQFLADIMLLVNDAMKVIRLTNISSVKKKELDYNVPYYVLPKLYGKIISSQTYLPLESADVTLYLDSNVADSLFEDWKNPLNISKQDNGIYTFAPFPVKAQAPFSPRSFTLKIVVKKGEKEFEKTVQYEAVPIILQNMELDFHENVMPLEDIYVPF